MDTKRCTKCGEEKPTTAEYFSRDDQMKRGLKSQCKSCRNKYYAERDREQMRAYRKQWCEENPEKKRVGQKKWREENPEYHKKYREKNREKVKACKKKYCEENSEQIRAYHRKYMRQRVKQDPIFRLLHNMRNGLWSCLAGVRKNSRTMQYVGMTPDELMDYLEGRFTGGMTRDNYGKWHVDHIRPISSFDFTGPDNEEQLHMAWNYTNLQPLWAADNMSKGAKCI